MCHIYTDDSYILASQKNSFVEFQLIFLFSSVHKFSEINTFTASFMVSSCLTNL
uniref:Uncharacterized protein n=1 Tax=Oryza brachyantha TaxID=4533 RepID=J3MTB1_ORYBR